MKYRVILTMMLAGCLVLARCSDTMETAIFHEELEPGAWDGSLWDRSAWE